MAEARAQAEAEAAELAQRKLQLEQEAAESSRTRLLAEKQSQAAAPPGLLRMNRKHVIYKSVRKWKAVPAHNLSNVRR
jgi:hypothetical protein